MTKLNSLIFLFVFSIAAIAVESAPIPLTSSSIFISEKNGLFRSPHGFSLHLANTKWVQVPKPNDNSYIEAIYRSQEDINVQAQLTVRVDKTAAALTLDQYSQKWMKDYPRFGFEILMAKKVRVGDEIAFLLDLVNRENSKQLRQVLFLKNQAAVTLTCRDDISNFNNTLKDCNEIMRTFKW